MTRGYSSTPAVDTEVGRLRPGAASAGLVPTSARISHLATQQRSRVHDAMVEQLRTTRATKDRDRIYPRAEPGQVKARAGRHALAADQARVPLTTHQAGQQQRSKRAAQERMPATEKRALQQLVGGEREAWESLNETLVLRGHGRAQLTADQARQVGRVDRAIRRFEKTNDRSHRTYAALDLDPEIAAAPAKHFTAGQRYTLDGYTAMDHSPHKVSDQPVLLEVTGTRGIYLGSGDPTTSTQHLMPRGITLEIDGVHDVDIVTDHGTVRRRIVQAHLTEPDTPSTPKEQLS